MDPDLELGEVGAFSFASPPAFLASANFFTQNKGGGGGSPRSAIASSFSLRLFLSSFSYCTTVFFWGGGGGVNKYVKIGAIRMSYFIPDLI